MAVVIREADADDVGRIVLFNQAMARETEGRELDRRTLSKGVEALIRDPARGRYFVAVKGEEVVGQVMITTEWSDWRNGQVWWLQSVYVSRRHRREGIYRGLHEHVREAALAEKVIGIRLYVDRDNLPAQETYRSLGMAESQYLMYEEMWA
ncbi:MAG: GNAT family N-acetyltransferase [Candidatus Palauibacterales bacterium]|nr:GNAT family N-acetyltransferase [Candidatus Palauibacterales bacterium]MDP2483231.1 GNAT family N-acetyltransferase [Candidatus Palauibacterales bacterium]